MNTIKQLFETKVVVKVAGPKQEGPSDCELYAIVNSVLLAYGKKPV